MISNILSLPKMLSGANAFEINDIERMNIGAHQPGCYMPCGYPEQPRYF